MERKRYPRFVSLVFTLIASGHALRLILGWQVLVSGVLIPMWISIVVILVAGCLAYYGYKYAK